MSDLVLNPRARAAVLAAVLTALVFDGVELGLMPVASLSVSQDLLGAAYTPTLGGEWFARFTAALMLGAAIGGIALGQLGDRIGRTHAMGISVLFYSIFAGLGAFVRTQEQMLALRFLVGLGVGGMWPNGVALVSECWPNASRPLVSGVMMAGLNSGILLLSQLARVWTIAPHSWRWIFQLAAIPAALGIVVLLALPESPKWLASRSKVKQPVLPLRELFQPALLKMTLLSVLVSAIPMVGAWAASSAEVFTSLDPRRILDRKDVDAVVIATPNHWHALLAVWACQAGKDVYVEKPVSHSVWEGRQIIRAAARYKRIVQAGTQYRSDAGLLEAAEYLRQGNLGKILWGHVLWYELRFGIGRKEPYWPEGLDYDIYCGPAPLEPLTRPKLHYDWHWFWSAGDGDLANSGIHALDVCRMLAGIEGQPPRVLSLGGRFGVDDTAQTPNTQLTVLDYRPVPVLVENRNLPAEKGRDALDQVLGIREGVILHCEGGYFAGLRGGGGAYDHGRKRLRQFIGDGGSQHASNFIAAVRSRKAADLRSPIEQGHISSAGCHWGNISYRLGSAAPPAAVREALAEMKPDASCCWRGAIRRRTSPIFFWSSPSGSWPRSFCPWAIAPDRRSWMGQRISRTSQHEAHIKGSDRRRQAGIAQQRTKMGACGLQHLPNGGIGAGTQEAQETTIKAKALSEQLEDGENVTWSGA